MSMRSAESSVNTATFIGGTKWCAFYIRLTKASECCVRVHVWQSVLDAVPYLCCSIYGQGDSGFCEPFRHVMFRNHKVRKRMEHGLETGQRTLATCAMSLP